MAQRGSLLDGVLADHSELQWVCFATGRQCPTFVVQSMCVRLLLALLLVCASHDVTTYKVLKENQVLEIFKSVHCRPLSASILYFWALMNFGTFTVPLSPPFFSSWLVHQSAITLHPVELTYYFRGSCLHRLKTPHCRQITRKIHATFWQRLT